MFLRLLLQLGLVHAHHGVVLLLVLYFLSELWRGYLFIKFLMLLNILVQKVNVFMLICLVLIIRVLVFGLEGIFGILSCLLALNDLNRVLILNKLGELFFIPSFVLFCQLVVGLLLFFPHLEPFTANMLHDFLGRPVRMEQLELFPVLLTKVDVGGQGLFGSGRVFLGSGIRIF